MSFNLKTITLIANGALITWLLWHFAFMRGYQDAVNDLAKKGYSFQETQRAFR